MKALAKNLERCSMIEAYEVRQVLEMKAVELIVRNASEDDINDLEKACRELEVIFEETRRTIGEFELHRLYAKKQKSVHGTDNGDCFIQHLRYDAQ